MFVVEDNSLYNAVDTGCISPYDVIDQPASTSILLSKLTQSPGRPYTYLSHWTHFYRAMHYYY